MDRETISVACGCGERLGFPVSRVGKPANCPACNRGILILGEVDADARVAHGALTIVSGPGAVGEQLCLVGTSVVEIGKLPGLGLRLNGKQVSRRHCRLVPVGTNWRIEDNNSTNGLFVNEERVIRHDLSHGDLVRVGDYELSYISAVRAGRDSAGLDDSSADDEGEIETYALGGNLGDLYALAEGGEVIAEPEPSHDGKDASVPEEDVICPSCERRMRPGTQICVDCGIEIKTGRSIITSQQTNLDDIYAGAEGVIGWASWLFPIGLYPIASEAFGLRKPYATRAIAIITILVSAWFLAYEWSGSPRMQTMKNLMLWPAEGELPARELAGWYAYTGYGDNDAFLEACYILEERDPELTENEIVVAAHQALRPDQQVVGRYRTSQLLTHAFLHGGPMHLIANLIFLLVFGSRVNALVGNTMTVLTYPVLAAIAGLAYLASIQGEPPTPMLGASGAIMGLAGMYFVFFPMHKVHMAAWARWGILVGFHLSLKMWSVRGFWVVLFYIAVDIFMTAQGVDDGTAHWAHIGGFGIGVAVGLILLLTRSVNGRGGDIVSALLGKTAWLLVGRPRQDGGFVQTLP